MLKFKRVDSKSGRPMYYKNGKMVSKNAIPESILVNLEAGVELSMPSPDEDQTVDAEAQTEGQSKQEKTCIFCGKVADKQRYVNQAVIDLCKEDYDSHTTGEIVQKLRETAEANQGE